MPKLPIALAILLAPAAVMAQGREAVSFDQALALSEEAPPVEGTRRALEARRAGDLGIGGTATPLRLSIMPGVLLGRGANGANIWQGQTSIYQGWNLADLGGARRRAAARERGALTAQVRARALAARLDAARRWIELWTLERVSALAREEESLAARRVELTQRGLEAGVATRADLAEARAYAAEVGDQQLTLAGQVYQTSLQLAVAMGRNPTGRLSASGEPPAPQLPSDDALQLRAERVDALPEVNRRRLEALASRAREVEVAASAAPVLYVGAQIQHEDFNPQALILGAVQMRVPIFDHGERARSQAAAETARLDAQHRQARIQARSDLLGAIHEAQHGRRRWALANEQLLPAVRRLLAERQQALSNGEGTVFALMDARRQAFAGRRAAARARGALAWAEVRLWLLLSALSGDAT